MQIEEMIFVGYGYGRFKTETNSMRDYCNVFMLQDFSGEQNNDYHFGGHKAVKYGCISPDVFKDIKVGTRVQVFFSSNGQVGYLAPVTKA